MQILLLPILLAQPALRPGWPIPILHESEYGYWGGPKAYDVDFDGEKEILFAAGTAESGGILYAFNLDGTFPPGWPVQVGEPPLFCEQSPVVGDLDGDYIPEIAVGTFSMSGETGGIHAFELNGTPVQNFPIPAPPNLDVMFPLSLALITPDSVPDILVSFSHYSGNPLSDQIGIIDPTTQEFIDGWPISLQWVDSRLIFVPPHQVVAYMSENVYAVSAWYLNSDPVPGWPVAIPGFPGNSMPAVADVNQDTIYEIIAPWDGLYAPLDTSYFYVFRPNGSILPGFPLSFHVEDFHSPPAIADIDQDGEVEIIQDGLGHVYIFNPDGTFLTINTDFIQFGGEPALADVDGDGQLEIIVGRSFITDSSYIGAFRLNGSQPQGWPLQVAGSHKGTPLIDDLDGDGYLEMIVFTTSDPWSHPDTGWLYLFDLPAPFDSALVPWGQYAHDLWNSGIYGFNPPVSVAEKPPVQIPSTYRLVYKDGIPELVFTLSHPQTIQLNLYDVAGRSLWRESIRYSVGIHKLKIPVATNTGLYVMRVEGDQTHIYKVIKLR